MARPDQLADRRLRPFLDRARIDCEYVLEYRCPLYWGDLRITGDPTTRFCDQCQQNVYMVTSETEFAERVARRECIAVVMADELPTPEQAAAAGPSVAVMGMFA